VLGIFPCRKRGRGERNGGGWYCILAYSPFRKQCWGKKSPCSEGRKGGGGVLLLLFPGVVDPSARGERGEGGKGVGKLAVLTQRGKGGKKRGGGGGAGLAVAESGEREGKEGKEGKTPQSTSLDFASRALEGGGKDCQALFAVVLHLLAAGRVGILGSKLFVSLGRKGEKGGRLDSIATKKIQSSGIVQEGGKGGGGLQKRNGRFLR